MTPSQIKQQQENLVRLSLQYTQQDLDAVMKQHPEITCNGIETRKSHNYESNRDYLKNSLKAFQYCCAFLSLCTKSNRTNWNYANNDHLKHLVEIFTHTPIPSGAIVAAAEVIGIKYKPDSDTCYVSLYINRNLPITEEMEYVARGGTII